MSGADELDEAIALANSGRTRPAPPPAPRLKRIRRIQWAEEHGGDARAPYGPGGPEDAADGDVGGNGPDAPGAPGAPGAAGSAPVPGDGTRGGGSGAAAGPGSWAGHGTGTGTGTGTGGAGHSGRSGGSDGGDASGAQARAGADAPSASEARPPHAPSVTWPEARSLAAGTPVALPLVTLPLDRTLGHTLAAPLPALTDLPSFDTSAMDGWAVSGPGPWELATGADGAEAPGILAGDRREPGTLADGQAVRIATGARVPPGTSAVLRSEHAERTSARRLRTSSPPQPGTDIRPRGQECRKGDELLPAGTHITPAVLGLAAGAGYDELDVVRRPRAEVLVLGDELLHRGLPSDGRIRDALGPLVGPWLSALGADVIVTRRLGDDAEALHEAMANTTADLVVTTGGTASGPVDHLQPALRKLAARLLIHGVRVRPGHPMLLAALGNSGAGRGGSGREGSAERPTYVVGLPGNPLAALSGLVTLAAPLIRTLGGRQQPRQEQGTLGEEVHGHPSDTRLVPVAHEGTGARARVRPLRFNGPAMLRGIAAADALAVVPPGGSAPGTDVELLGLPW